MQTNDILILVGSLALVAIICFFILWYSKKDLIPEDSQEGDTPLYVEDNSQQKGAFVVEELSAEGDGDQVLF